MDDTERDFTPDILRRLLHDSILKGSQKPPNNDGLRQLAETLNGLRAIADMNRSQVGRDHNRRATLAASAARALLQILPEMRTDAQEAEAFFCSLEDPEMENFRLHHRSTAGQLDLLIDLLQHLLDAGAFVPLSRAGIRLSKTEMFNMGSESWHEFTSRISAAFRDAMKTTNANPLGNSNDGPVARFVAAVIPFITEETPTVQAVGQHLKRSVRPGT